MRITFGRKSRIATLGAGLLIAAVVAVSGSGPALADTTDTGGTASLSVPVAVVAGLAHAKIVMLPATPASSSFDPTSGTNTVTQPVTGGNAEVTNLYGILQLGGSLVLINAGNGKSVTVTDMRLNFFTAALQGKLSGGTSRIALGYVRGIMSTSTNSGPPLTETFTTDEIDLSGKAATALNTALGTKVFIRGTDIGAFTTTFEATIS